MLFNQILLAGRILRKVTQECQMTIPQLSEGIDISEEQVEEMVGLLADLGLLKRVRLYGTSWVFLTSSGLHFYSRWFCRPGIAGRVGLIQTGLRLVVRSRNTAGL